MKKLHDYKEEIHKCSKCGLCQSVCPIYEITGNDCSVSRGKFIMLNGIIKGDLKLNKNINKYLDMCLKCNACKDFCPSGIDAREIFLTAKSDYFKQNPSGKLISLFQSKFVFSSTLKFIKFASSTYRILKIDKIIPKFYPLFLKMGWVGKKIILTNEFILVKEKGERKKEKEDKQIRDDKIRLKIVYFKGCVNEFINPSVKNATENVLSNLGAEIIPTNFDCCGMPFLSSGNTEQVKKQAVFNLSQIPDDFDYFITDCASCQDAFKIYKKIIEDEKLLEKIDKIIEKSINVNEFLIKNINKIKFDKKTTFTFHKPCHMESIEFLKIIVEKSENLEYIEMEEFDKCCGFSGEFAIKNPELSEKISKKKAKNALNANADYILTSCPACTLGLTQGIIEAMGENYEEGTKLPKVLNLIEFLAAADEIY